MDLLLDVVASQLAQEWEAMMQGFWTFLVGTTLLGALTVALVGTVAASVAALRLRRFWCPSIGRDVEVQFEEWGPPGFRQVLRVVGCSAFDPAGAIACRRTCVDATCRRPSAAFGLFGLRPAHFR